LVVVLIVEPLFVSTMLLTLLVGMLLTPADISFGLKESNVEIDTLSAGIVDSNFKQTTHCIKYQYNILPFQLHIRGILISD
jgi:hypothetical protein